MYQHVGAVAGTDQQVRGVVVASDDQAAGFAGNVSVIVTPEQAAILQCYIVSFLQFAPAGAGLYAFRP